MWTDKMQTGVKAEAEIVIQTLEDAYAMGFDENAEALLQCLRILCEMSMVTAEEVIEAEQRLCNVQKAERLGEYGMMPLETRLNQPPSLEAVKAAVAWLGECAEGAQGKNAQVIQTVLQYIADFWEPVIA